MKLRTHKRNILARMAFNRAWQRYLDSRVAAVNHRLQELLDSWNESPAAKAKRAEEFDQFWDALVTKQAVRQLVEPVPEPEVEAAKIEYVVAKVSTGEVISTFDMRDDALALIKKHARQKKAKLMLVPMDGVEPFTEEELTA